MVVGEDVMTSWAPALLPVVATPVLGAVLGLLLWGNPRVLKVWGLLVAAASLLAVCWSFGSLSAAGEGLPFLLLPPLGAFVSLLGQPAHRSNQTAWLLTLLLLGIGLGALAGEGPLGQILLLLVLALVALLLSVQRALPEPAAWWGIGTLGLGVLSLATTLFTVSPVSSLAFLVGCAIALPLVPFHQGYLAAVTGLPGNLPAFLALLLPVLGFHGLRGAIPHLPDAPAQAAVGLALTGALYGSLKALAQSRPAARIAYGNLAFLSILWWYLAETRTTPPQTAVYLSAVVLAGGGLLLAWYALRARYGEVDLRALSGLARPMPRFAVALSLLALAALGLPPFGVFSGLVGLLLAPSYTATGGLVVVVIAWLCASWYFFDLAHRLLFGQERTTLRHQDLRGPESASLALVIALLLMLGLMPSRLFESGPAPFQRTVTLEPPAWTK
jgi:NADH-quinone oxidoreductase subunit M